MRAAEVIASYHDLRPRRAVVPNVQNRHRRAADVPLHTRGDRGPPGLTSEHAAVDELASTLAVDVVLANLAARRPVFHPSPCASCPASPPTHARHFQLNILAGLRPKRPHCRRRRGRVSLRAGSAHPPERAEPELETRLRDGLPAPGQACPSNSSESPRRPQAAVDALPPHTALAGTCRWRRGRSDAGELASWCRTRGSVSIHMVRHCSRGYQDKRQSSSQSNQDWSIDLPNEGSTDPNEQDDDEYLWFQRSKPCYNRRYHPIRSTESSFQMGLAEYQNQAPHRPLNTKSRTCLTPWMDVQAIVQLSALMLEF